MSGIGVANPTSSLEALVDANQDGLGTAMQVKIKFIGQLYESAYDTLNGQLDLEAHGVRTFEGVAIRVGRRILVMARQVVANRSHDRFRTAPLAAAPAAAKCPMPMMPGR